jgi:hypothetical protein
LDFNTWILQASSLPQMQGAGHAAVVYYRKCPATRQMRLNRRSRGQTILKYKWQYSKNTSQVKKHCRKSRCKHSKYYIIFNISRLSVQDSGNNLLDATVEDDIEDNVAHMG